MPSNALPIKGFDKALIRKPDAGGRQSAPEEFTVNARFLQQ